MSVFGLVFLSRDGVVTRWNAYVESLKGDVERNISFFDLWEHQGGRVYGFNMTLQRVTDAVLNPFIDDSEYLERF